MHGFFIHSGIRVQSLNKGQIIMDIDFRWGGDPNIVLGVEAALVASIPIQVRLSRIILYWISCSFAKFLNLECYWFLLQLKDLQVFSIIRVIFQLAEEIPCISAVVVALLAEVTIEGWCSTKFLNIHLQFRMCKPFCMLLQIKLKSLVDHWP